MGMIESITESLHGLLIEAPGSDSGSDSSKGSHHPSQECFMVGTPEGHVKSISTEVATRRATSAMEPKGGQWPHLT